MDETKLNMDKDSAEYKARKAAVEEAIKGIFPTRKEKAAAILRKSAFILLAFFISLGLTAVGWNMLLCAVFPALPVLTFKQLVAFMIGIRLVNIPFTSRK